jgi:hypothetical protein
MRHPAFSNSLPLAAAALLMFAAGCNRDGVKVYKVDSSDVVATTAPPIAVAPPLGMPATMPDGLAAPDNSGLPKLKYTLPDGWKEKAPSQMRVASFDISENGKTVDVSVVPLGAMSGGDGANVNRWRGQVGQSPMEDAALKQSAEPVQVGDKPADLYDIAGTDPNNANEERIIGAILHADDATWYFKMMGDAALVEKNKPAFLALLKSVQFQSSTGVMPPMDMSQLPAGHPAIPGVALQSQTPPGDKPSWAVPSGWKEGELTQFLVAKYVIQGNGDAAAAVNVSQLDGDGGGLLPNINRWRGQLGQPPITDDDAAKLPTIDATGAKAVVADFIGTDTRDGGKSARLVGVVLPLNGQTWFYKLMGDPDVVSQQKDAFVTFIQSAKYPAAK